MEIDVGALQMLPEAESEIGLWPCTVSNFDADDEE
jgi:hypothetical protein